MDVRIERRTKQTYQISIDTCGTVLVDMNIGDVGFTVHLVQPWTVPSRFGRLMAHGRTDQDRAGVSVGYDGIVPKSGSWSNQSANPFHTRQRGRDIPEPTSILALPEVEQSGSSNPITYGSQVAPIAQNSASLIASTGSPLVPPPQSMLTPTAEPEFP